MRNGTRMATRLGRALALPALLASAALVTAATPAPTPPMGWNSWDAFGLTITEAQFRANVQVLAGMASAGWRYAVIDEGWYMANPFGAHLADRRYQLDGFGRLTPVASRFPSAVGDAGLKPLADWTHRQGLKFGIHIVRGIPKAAADANMPIAGSSYRAADAADRAETCPWDDGNYGIADNAAGQAYYDSLISQYAGWGVDLIKVDCISDHPYRPSEIRQIAAAIRKAGRPMVLSLSPGPTALAHAAEVQSQAQMWRIMDDLWDSWTFPHPDPASTFPNGVRNAFDALAAWNPYSARGSWPDADMLPFGMLAPHPGWGDPRHSRLSEAETRTAFTLWSIARSPLILGGDLTRMDPWLRPMLTNRQVVALDQADRRSRPVDAGLPDARVWVSGQSRGAVDTVAIFNVGDRALDVRQAWSMLGADGGRQAACDLWTGRAMPTSDHVATTIAPHDVALLRIGRCATR